MGFQEWWERQKLVLAKNEDREVAERWALQGWRAASNQEAKGFTGFMADVHELAEWVRDEKHEADIERRLRNRPHGAAGKEWDAASDYHEGKISYKEFEKRVFQARSETHEKEE